MKNRKRAVPFILFTLLIGLLLFFSITKSIRSEYTSNDTPTLFLHGYKGSERSFATMLERLERRGPGEKQMIVRVTEKGKVQIKGDLEGSAPLVQVIFEDARASIDQQKDWLKSIMSALKDDYGVDHINLVGHSMGGLSLAGFLAEKEEDAPDVNKLVVMASPFNGIEKEGYFKVNFGDAATDLRPESKALVDLKKRQIDSVDVLAIAGVINREDRASEQWDGLVKRNSVRGIQSLVPRHRIQFEIVRGNFATHSGLHESPYVDKLVADFLWKEPDTS
ncbi:alpha/beta hydrolase [Halobacillus litoralis]|uniref:alpha/beta hydrolase n=1 Tax=Halobacillus litoralis TaxID=45668 RepID=UPI001CD5690D|nr:alpha/beta hydrolase [Halobacillus litoralis]MCA0972575.1 alpha/beta hydrolase [Halobacillus litoralis]